MGFSPKAQTGKLMLSIGRKESFSAMDFFMFPIRRQNIQKFHEVPGKPKGNGCWR